jgi:hypothetical protein
VREANRLAQHVVGPKGKGRCHRFGFSWALVSAQKKQCGAWNSYLLFRSADRKVRRVKQGRVEWVRDITGLKPFASVEKRVLACYKKALESNQTA